MSLTIETSQGIYQKPSKKRTTAAIVAGLATLSGIAYGYNRTLGKYIGQKLVDTSAQAGDIKPTIEETLKSTGLQDKGVTVRYFTRNEAIPDKKAINEYIETELKDFKPKSIKEVITKYKKIFIKSFKDVIDIKIAKAIKNGENAIYCTIDKTINLHDTKSHLAVFHEMGHAVNQNMSKFWNGVKKCKFAANLAPILLLIALFTRKKADGETPNGKTDKVRTFIKNNVGKLAILCTLPKLAEELRASQVGNKIAKKALSPELAQKVKLINRYSALSYVATTLLTGVSIYLANKVRDKIASPKEI